MNKIILDIFEFICKEYKIFNNVLDSNLNVMYIGKDIDINNILSRSVIKCDKITIEKHKIMLGTNALSPLHNYLYIHKDLIPYRPAMGEIYYVTNILGFFKIMETYYTNVDSFKEKRNVIFNETLTSLIKNKSIQSELDKFISTNYFYVSFFYIILSDELKAKYEHINDLKDFELFTFK